MAISMFSSQASPIAIDFGTSSVKVLQVSSAESPELIDAAQINVPDAVRSDVGKRFEFLSEELPKAIRRGRFKGKRATCSIPSSRTFVQHLQVPTTGSLVGEEFIHGQLHALTGLPPNNLVIRTSDVAEVTRGEGGVKRETICFAVPRDVVMRQIELLKRCKLDVAGVHTEQHAIVWAYAHIHRREGDEQLTNLYIDIGWSSTKVGISHGNTLVFAKSIPIGGRHLDQHMAETLKCDLATARAHRLATVSTSKAQHVNVAAGANTTGVSGGNAYDDAGVATAEDRRAGATPESLHEADDLKVTAPPMPPGIDFTELYDSISDELAMCLRYHRALFGGRPIDRAIFLGNESTNVDLCRAFATRLRLPAMLADPLARVKKADTDSASNVELNRILPGWTVACGLCCGPDA